jgi:hypothetical protein
VSHYDITRWIDYLRGLVDVQEHSEMTRHLSECKSCRATHDLFARVAVRMQSDLQYEIPEYVIHNARAIFPAVAPAKRTLLQKLTGSLVFDSFQQPALAGARTGTPGMRHALYEAGDYSVDIRLEEERGSTQVNMVGQLALRSNTAESLDRVPVMLMSGRKIVAEAVSNEFGEFQLSYEPKPRLKLHVPIRHRKQCIELPLGSLVTKPGKRSGERFER